MHDRPVALEIFEDLIRVYVEVRTAVEEAQSELEGVREDLEEAEGDLRVAISNYAATGVSEEEIDARLEKAGIEIVL